MRLGLFLLFILGLVIILGVSWGVYATLFALSIIVVVLWAVLS